MRGRKDKGKKNESRYDISMHQFLVINVFIKYYKSIMVKIVKSKGGPFTSCLQMKYN